MADVHDSEIKNIFSLYAQNSLSDNTARLLSVFFDARLHCLWHNGSSANGSNRHYFKSSGVCDLQQPADFLLADIIARNKPAFLSYSAHRHRSGFFDEIILEKYIGSTSNYTLSPEEALLPGFYIWQVSANDGDWGYGESQIGSFEVLAEPSIDPLILQYEPILYFHPDEDFYPMNVESFVENSGLWDSHGLEQDELHELLKPESDENPVILTDLTPQSQDTANWYLQFSQDLTDKTPDPAKAKAEYQTLVSSSQAKPTYYARKMEDSYADDQGTHEFTVLQYWYFYAFNDFGAKVEKGNNHEGDWESVMIFLDKDSEEPRYAAYSAHHNQGQIYTPLLQTGSVRRSWDSNELNKQDEQVISFVAVGSHANYPDNGNDGKHEIYYYSDDQTSFGGFYFDTDSWDNIFAVKENDMPKWITDYKGKWGLDSVDIKEEYSGPNGPYYDSEFDKFHHPIQWAGIDKIGQKTITEQGIATVNFIQSNTKMVFEQALALGTQITVDLHNEVISLGQNLQNLLLAPHFWDIASSLANGEFQAEVSFIYNPEEMQVLGITNPAKLTVFVYGETGQIWQEVPSAVDINNNLIKFQTDHFSRYAIGIKKIQFQDITDKVKIIENKKHYDKKTGIQEIDFKIKNNAKEEIKGMLLLSISDLTQGIEFVNPDDLTSLNLRSTGLPENLQAVNFSDSYRYCLFTRPPALLRNAKRAGQKGNLLGGFTEDKTLQFKVPDKKKKKFDYEARVWGEILE